MALRTRISRSARPPGPPLTLDPESVQGKVVFLAQVILLSKQYFCLSPETVESMPRLPRLPQGEQRPSEGQS